MKQYFIYNQQPAAKWQWQATEIVQVVVHYVQPTFQVSKP